ncbi:MAG: winged helix-turn-helix domain-containing protein [Planctomycetaceae bacterium]
MGDNGDEGPLGHHVDSVGMIAGMVWKYLDVNGAVTLSKLAREIDAPRDLVMQGVGWLAREGKIEFQEGSRNKLIALV